jgi:hypothetical protein
MVSQFKILMLWAILRRKWQTNLNTPGSCPDTAGYIRAADLTRRAQEIEAAIKKSKNG